jgi:hypothetical protein
MDNSNNLTAERLQRRRNRKRLSLRIITGLSAIRKRPWKVALLIIAAFAVSVVWGCIEKSLPAIEFFALPLAEIVQWTVKIFMFLLYFYSLAGLIIFLGTPRNARRIEDRLFLAFERNDLIINGCPILVSRERIKGTKIYILDFYSMGIALRRWEELQAEIEDALNVNLVEPIQYRGNNRNRILLYCAHGVKPLERGDLIE